MEKYSNKRILHRTSGGKYRAAQASDIGIMGMCPVCHHFLICVYDGPQNDPFPDPRKFRNRCFTCEPETEQEKAAKPEAPKFSVVDFFKNAAG